MNIVRRMTTKRNGPLKPTGRKLFFCKSQTKALIIDVFNHDHLASTKMLYEMDLLHIENLCRYETVDIGTFGNKTLMVTAFHGHRL